MDPSLSKARFDRDAEILLKNKQNFDKIGLRLIKSDYPILIIAVWWTLKNKELFLHIQADDYDYQPIRGWWVDENDTPLIGGKGQIPNGAGFQVNSTPYQEQKSWFCFRGWREYHDHESHQDISWESICSDKQYRIPGIILQLKSDLGFNGVQSN